MMGLTANSVIPHGDTIAGLTYIGRRFVADCARAEDLDVNAVNAQGQEYRRPHYWAIWRWEPGRARATAQAATGRNDPRPPGLPPPPRPGALRPPSQPPFFPSSSRCLQSMQ